MICSISALTYLWNNGLDVTKNLGIRTMPCKLPVYCLTCFRLKLTHDPERGWKALFLMAVLSQPTLLPRWNEPLPKYQSRRHNSVSTKLDEVTIPMRQTLINNIENPLPRFTPPRTVTCNCFLFNFYRTHKLRGLGQGIRGELIDILLPLL